MSATAGSVRTGTRHATASVTRSVRSPGRSSASASASSAGRPGAARRPSTSSSRSDGPTWLVPEPGGFEGLFAVGEFVYAHDLVIAQRVDLVEAAVNRDPACPAPAPEVRRDEDAVARVDELLRFTSRLSHALAKRCRLSRTAARP